MENITWNEYKARSNALNGFRVTHYSALFHAAHCRVEIDGRDFQLAWDDRYSTKEWNNQVNQFKKEHLSNFVEITALVCEEIKTKLEDYKAELILVQAHLSTGLAGTDYNGAIANKDNIEKMITIYTRLVSMLPVFNDDLTTEVQNIITVNEGLLEVETDFYKKRTLENKINFYNRVLNNLPVVQEEKEVMCDELTKLSDEQLTIVEQVYKALKQGSNVYYKTCEYKLKLMKFIATQDGVYLNGNTFTLESFTQQMQVLVKGLKDRGY